MKELGITKGEVKPEFTIEQIRAFVAKNYNSVSARYVKSALQHYDELLQQRDELREDIEYLARRQQKAGSVSFTAERETGVSSNSIVSIACLLYTSPSPRDS